MEPQVGEEVATLAANPRRRGRWLKLVRRDPLTLAGLLIVTLLVAVALVGPLLVRFNPTLIDPETRLLPPGPQHLLGTDALGRDILSRIVYGARLSLLVAVVVTAISGLVGLLVGAVAAYAGRWVDEVLMRGTDIFLSFPWLLLAMAVAMAAGPSLWNGMLALSFVWWPGYARVLRSQVLVTKSMGYVEAAKAVGLSSSRILLRHIIPNSLGPYVVLLTVGAGRIILAMASLSFIGLGAQPPMPEWGVMVSDGRRFLFDAWWMVTFPGLAVLLACVGFNLLGDGLRDVLDPTSTDR
jgi:peptide/nickel transport system permease protein